MLKNVDLYKALAELSTDAIYVLNNRGKIFFSNYHAAKLLGYDNHTNLKGRNILEFISEDYKNKAKNDLSNASSAAENKLNGKSEYIFIKKDGCSFKGEINITIIKNISRKNPILLYMVNEKNVKKNTSARKVNNLLEENEVLYRMAIDFTLDWEFWINQENRFIYVSSACERISGYSPEEFLIDPDLFSKIIHPEDRAVYTKHIEHQEGLANEVDFRIIRKNGGECWISHMCHPVYSKDGRYLGRRATNRDITKRKKTEEALLAAGNYNRKLIETSLDPLVTIGPDGKITDVNSATETITGCSRKELIGRDFSNYFTDPVKARKGYQQVFKKGLVRDYALEIRHRDGHITPVLYNASVYRDHTGQVIGVFAAARDVTELRRAEMEVNKYRMHLEDLVKKRTLELQKVNTNLEAEISEHRKAEEALNLSEEKYRTIVETANEGIWVVDENRCTTYMNDKMIEMLGYSREEIKGKRLKDFTDTEGKKISDLNIKKRKTGIGGVYEYKLIRSDGSPLWTLVNAKPQFDAEGKFVGIVSMLTDITHRKKTEEMIQHQIRNLELLSRAGLYFLKISPDQDILSYIGKKLYSMVPDAIIIVSSYDPLNNTTTVQCVFGSAEDLKKIETALGQNPLGLSYIVEEKYRKMMSEGELQKVPGGLYGLTFEQIPVAMCRNIEAYIGIKNVYAMPFTVYGDMLGTAAIITHRTEPLHEARIIEAFIGMAAVAVGRWRAEEKIMREKQYSDILINNLPGIFYALDSNARMLQTNNMFSVISGYSPDEITYMKVMDFFTGEDKKDIEYWISEVFEKGESTVEAGFNSREGKIIPCFFTGSKIMRDGKPVLIGMGIDITDRKQWEAKIETSLKEKEMLLREIHHRVKNNLQIISSILNLQSNYMHNKDANEVFLECQNRVKSMALIHEKLYLSGDLSNINIKDYVNDISVKLFSSFFHGLKNIRLNLNVEDIYLDIDKSIAVGLILNELISNSLKHAFTDRKEGEIKISFYRETDNKLILIVSDNGKGFPPNFDFENTKTLGLLLVSSLTDQHKGSMKVDSFKGTTFKVTLNM